MNRLSNIYVFLYVPISTKLSKKNSQNSEENIITDPLEIL